MTHQAYARTVTAQLGACRVWLWPRTTDDRERAYRFDPSAVLTMKQRALPRLAAPLLCIFFVGVLGISLLRHLRSSLPAAWGWAPGMVLLALLIYVGALATRVREIAMQERIAKRRGVCAAYGYSLREIDAEEDGCRTCPECGAAWKFAAPCGDGGV